MYTECTPLVQGGLLVLTLCNNSSSNSRAAISTVLFAVVKIVLKLNKNGFDQRIYILTEQTAPLVLS